MIRRVVTALFLFASIARGASAQRDTVLLADSEANAELVRIVSAARDAGLPVNPIFGRVRYGVSVAHAPPAIIVAKVRALVARLEAARDALAPDTSAAEIASGADALEQKATKDQLLAVRNASRDQPVSMSLGVLTQLLASGVSPKRAAAIITALLKRHASARQLVALGTDVNADVANGAQANAALDIRLRGLTDVLAPLGASATSDPSPAAMSPLVPKKKP
jgi:hypothetical protein